MQKITIIGYLGKKPEERFTKDGKKLISFSIAVGVWKDLTQWYTCNIWEERVPFFQGILPFLDKGSRVCVMGELSLVESYKGRDGNMKVSLKITPSSIDFIPGTKNEPKEVKEDKPREENYPDEDIPF